MTSASKALARCWDARAKGEARQPVSGAGRRQRRRGDRGCRRSRGEPHLQGVRRCGPCVRGRRRPPARGARIPRHLRRCGHTGRRVMCRPRRHDERAGGLSRLYRGARRAVRGPRGGAGVRALSTGVRRATRDVRARRRVHELARTVRPGMPASTTARARPATVSASNARRMASAAAERCAVSTAPLRGARRGAASARDSPAAPTRSASTTAGSPAVSCAPRIRTVRLPSACV